MSFATDLSNKINELQYSTLPVDAVHWAKSAWDAALRGHLAKAHASARAKAKAKLADKKAARSPRA